MLELAFRCFKEQREAVGQGAKPEIGWRRNVCSLAVWPFHIATSQTSRASRDKFQSTVSAVVRCSLMICDVRNYCTQVARNSVMVQCAKLWITSEVRQTNAGRTTTARCGFGSAALRLLGYQLQLFCHLAEREERMGLHLSHQTAAVHLYRGFGDADIAGNLFAEATARDLNHDLALPGAQRRKALPESDQILFILPPSMIAREAELNGVEEFLIAERLGQELNGTTLHRLHRHGNIAMACDEDDWDLPARHGELALKIKAASSRQSDVEHQASGTVRRVGLKKFGD